MNPRAFCREPGYGSAILLTFNLDPLFFERVVLPDLWAGGTGEVVVLADASQVSDLAERWQGQLAFLGRSYQLIPVERVAGAFHPKVILRVSPQGGAIWVGSGNITHGGWGGNLELATAWAFGPGCQDPGAWAGSFLANVAALTPARLAHAVGQHAQGAGWLQLSQEGSDVGSPLLASFADRSLAAQLAARWSGRRFLTARCFTGSTDREGAVLRWLHEAFGVERATVMVNEDRCDLDPAAVAALPLAVDVLKPPDGSLHAKMIWLDGPDGAAAVVGSANCSAAAWLLAPARGGNVEVVAVYDDAATRDFAPALERFTADGVEPVHLVSRPPAEQEAPPAPPLRVEVAEVTWDSASGHLSVLLGRDLPPGTSLEVGLGREAWPLRPGGTDPLLWSAQCDDFTDESDTAFATVVVALPDGRQIRLLRWVNLLAELRHAARGRRIARTFDLLSTHATPTEQQQIVAELQVIAHALLHEPTSFPDPPRPNGTPPTPPEPDADTTTPAVDPRALVRSLAEQPEAEGLLSDVGPHVRVSLLGVVRALFPEQGSPHDPQGEEQEEAPGADAGEPRVDEKREEKPPSPAPPPSDRYRQRLAAQVGDFLARLRSADFAGQCTATQLVNAVAFPLAIAIRGRRAGWVDDDDALGWTRQVCDVLFHEVFSRRPRREGLLTVVRTRYGEAGRDEDFRRIVGDGTVWLALVACLGGLPWQGRAAALDRALALAALFRSRDLLASADAGRMRLLVSRLEQEELRRAVLQDAPLIVELSDRLEATLHRSFEALRVAQERIRLHHEAGDLLWHPTGGWAEALESAEVYKDSKLVVYRHRAAAEVEVRASFYVNVSWVARKAEEVRSLLEKIEACAGRFSAGRATSPDHDGE